MTDFTVGPGPSLAFGGKAVRCALGKGGILPATGKREGDGATPAGSWPLRQILYRPDRLIQPETALPLAPIAPSDGWCDAAQDPAYNRPVTLPYPASAEHLWREDRVYDIIVVLGHNDDPVVPGMGSAIFFHLATENYSPTEGCVAIALGDMLAALKAAMPDSRMIIPEAL